MADYPKLTDEQKDSVFREFRAISHQGYLDPAPVFAPSGFEFNIRYSGGSGRSLPIPEFRAYTQQYLSLLAIVLISYREFLPKDGASLRAELELAGDDLQLVLSADFPLLGPGKERPLTIIAIAFSSALRAIFPQLEQAIFWDWQPSSSHGKFWLKYPGAMTVEGLAITLRQPHVTLATKARLALQFPDDEQYRRALAVREFLLRDPVEEF